MKRLWSLVVPMGLLFAAGCKKEVEAPPPAPVEVAAPVVETVQPGMEAENPAEKEGKP